MTLDEAIAKYNKLANNEQTCYPEEAQQLAEWLEDYKRLARETEQDIYERAYKDGLDKGLSDGHFFGYNKAIDDFAELLRETRDNRTLRVNCDDLEIRHMADRLKDGDGE